MTPQLESLERAIAEVERAGEAYAVSARLEKTLQATRPLVEEQIKQRLLIPTKYVHQKFNPDDDEVVTMLPAKASSPSAAEKMVKLEPEYIAHLEQEREAVFQKNNDYTRLMVARLRALGCLVDAIRQTPNAMSNLLSLEVDLDLIRNRDDAREERPGGVPQ